MTSPVLFLIFNRPDETSKVFDAIRRSTPPKLFIAADGPRSTHENDPELCRRTREVVENIDWPCDVHRLYRTENLGCGIALSSAITWFFENVPKGIIIEDDCLPHDDFFTYCDLMLAHYKDSEDVMMISGMSYLRGAVVRSPPYYFSRFYSIWGWASWRRAWGKYDYSLTRYNDLTYRDVNIRIGHRQMALWMSRNLGKSHALSAGTWDLQWSVACFQNNGLCVTPLESLIQNIGFVGAHSSQRSPSQAIESHGIDLTACEIRKEPIWDQQVDHMTYDKILEPENTFIARLRKTWYWIINPALREFFESVGLIGIIRRLINRRQ